MNKNEKVNKIINLLSNQLLTANAIIIALNLPKVTVYRTLHYMEKANLIEKTQRRFYLKRVPTFFYTLKTK